MSGSFAHNENPLRAFYSEIHINIRVTRILSDELLFQLHSSYKLIPLTLCLAHRSQMRCAFSWWYRGIDRLEQQHRWGLGWRLGKTKGSEIRAYWCTGPFLRRSFDVSDEMRFVLVGWLRFVWRWWVPSVLVRSRVRSFDMCDSFTWRDEMRYDSFGQMYAMRCDSFGQMYAMRWVRFVWSECMRWDEHDSLGINTNH